LTDSLASNSDGNCYKKISAYSLLKGQFNVNSTSVSAWEALLRSNRDMQVVLSTGVVDGASGTPFAPSTKPTVIEGNEYWSGVERLTDAEISELAQNIVDEVMNRGPFLSLSDFVNRRLSNDEYGKSGALQSAIDASSLNDDVLFNSGGEDTQYDEGHYSSYFPDSAAHVGRKTTTGIVRDVTQAKILSSIGPRLNARSDTFRIRAYGESLSSNGDVKSRAMCEAWVQRVPEYYKSDDEPWDENYSNPLPYTANAPDDSLDQLNRKLGRKYKVVSLKWLNEDEY